MYDPNEFFNRPTTGGTSGGPSEYCENRLPCGVCTRLGTICPMWYKGAKITCEVK